MKQNYLWLNIVFFTMFSINSFAQIKTTTPYNAYHISITGVGAIWAFGDGAKGTGLYRKFNDWQFIEYKSDYKVVASSSTNGELIIVNSNGEIKEWNTNNRIWFSFKGITKVKDVCISESNRNNKYALGTVKQADGSLKTGLFMVENISGSASDWKLIKADSWAKSFIKVSEDQTGNFYFVSSSGRVFALYKGSNNYTELKMQGKFIKNILVGNDQNVYVQDREGTIYKMNKSTNTPAPMRFSATAFGVTFDGDIYGVVGRNIEALKKGVWSRITVPKPINPKPVKTVTPAPPVKVITTQPTNSTTSTTKSGSGTTGTTTTTTKTGKVNVNTKDANGDYPLILAARAGNSSTVNTLLNQNANPNSKDKNNHTALYYAVNSRNKIIAQNLLSNNANPNTEDYIGRAVELKDKQMIILLANHNTNLNKGLEKAAATNDTEIFKLLTDYGAKLTNNKPLEIAVDNGNNEMAALCLDKGANVNSALDYVVKKSNKDLMVVCLDRGGKASKVLPYAINNNDILLANSLVDNYNLNANTMLMESLPGAGKANQQKGKPDNLAVAEIALQKGALSSSYIDYAVKQKNNELVNMLMQYGGDNNQLLKSGVETNNTEYVRMAFDGGANIKAKDNLLGKAVNHNNTEMVSLLTDAGAMATKPEFITTAVNNSNTDMTRVLVANGAPTSDENLIKTAVSKNNKDIVNILLESGASKDAGLAQAVLISNLSFTQLFLNIGADATKPNLISIAAGKGNTDIVKLLLDNGADAENGVINSINAGSQSVFNLLLARGANPVNEDYVVAAVKAREPGIFTTLLENGAPVDYVNSNNENLIHLSVGNGHQAITSALIDAKVNVNQKNNSGLSPLMIAVKKKNNYGLVELLVNNGADINATDNRGKSVLKQAKGAKVKSLLKEKGAVK